MNLLETDKSVKPFYPLELRTNGVEGEALIGFVVGVDGFTHELKIARTTHEDFGKAAKHAVAQWIFMPGEIEEEEVNVATQMTIKFMITD